MKKLLTIAMMTAAVSALAVESSNTFGILRVDSTAAQTIVSVPWEGAGATGDSANKIMVKDVVKTANLTKAGTYDEVSYIGDQLYYYADGAYKLWVLNSSGVWEGANIVANNIQSTSGSDTTPIARGGAIILVRKDASQPFYLYGQYTSDATSISATRNANSPVYVLIAPPSTDDFAVSSVTGSGLKEGDALVFGDVSLMHNGTTWGKYEFSLATMQDEFTVSTAKIPVGTGAWLRLKKGTEETVTINYGSAQ